MKQHIYLVGFMGSGKSTVGRLLAQRLRRPFVDLDDLISEEHEKSIPEIFRQLGETAFRRSEHEAIRRSLTWGPSVIALGGGAFEDPENRSLITKNALSVWLKITLTTAEERCAGDTNRPLAQDSSAFQSLYGDRLAGYAEADIHVEADHKSPEDICQEIIHLVKSTS